MTAAPDGTQLASASNDGTVRLWDPASGQPTTTLEGHTGWVSAVAFSADGRRLASAGTDGTVRLWDPASRQLTGTLEGHTYWMRAVAFSPDGTQLASAIDDGTVRLWDAHDPAAISQLKLEGVSPARAEYTKRSFCADDSGAGEPSIWTWVAVTAQEAETASTDAPVGCHKCHQPA